MSQLGVRMNFPLNGMNYRRSRATELEYDVKEKDTFIERQNISIQRLQLDLAQNTESLRETQVRSIISM